MSAVLCFFICVKLMISSIYFLSCGFIPFYCFTIVVFLLISVSDSLQPHGLQHKRLPVLHHLPEFAQTHVHWVSDAIQPSHPLSSPSPPPLNLSQHQGLFQCVSSSHQVAWYWSFSFSIGPSNEYSALISFRVHWFDLLAVQETLKSLLQHHHLKASTVWDSALFVVQLSYPYMTTGKTIALTACPFVGKTMSLFLMCYLGLS